MEYIMGVDIGTSGTKAIAFGTGGEVLYTAYESYPSVSWHPDQHELEPAILLAAVIKLIREVWENNRSNHSLLGVSFSCALHSLIAVNEKGQPINNAITWADLRSKTYAAKLKGTVLGTSIYHHTGTPIHPMSPLCKLMWIREKQPAIFDQAHKFISIKEYIWYQFFGKYQVDYSIASGTGLFDIRRLAWYEPALEAAGITTNRLSDPVSPTHIERQLSKAYQNLTGLPEATPFIIGGSDGCLANLGCHAVHPGDMALTIGTSGAARMVSPEPRKDEKERIFNYVLAEDFYVSGGAINNGGLAVKWYVDNFMGKNGKSSMDFSAAVAETDSISPGSEGLIFLPYLLGERAPIWNADAKGVFFGIYSGHGSLHFLRAVIEGISFSLFQVGQSLVETVGPIKKIYASGGFIQSVPWLQMLADIFDREVCVTNSADASAVGAAIMGLYALKEIHDLRDADQLVQVKQSYFPIQKNHAIYMKNFSIFSVLYDRLKSEFTELSHFQDKD